MTYQAALLEAARNEELLLQYDRLSGTNLSGRGSTLDVLIDEASGRLEAEAAGFVAFFDEFIWSRVPKDSS